LVRNPFVILLPHYQGKEEEDFKKITSSSSSSSAFLENGVISELMFLPKVSIESIVTLDQVFCK
jgi:hypothetical protein